MSNLPSQWKLSTLSNICTMKSGDGITSKDISDSHKYPCYGGNGYRGKAASFTHEGNYILVGRVGALCGNVLKVRGKFFASEHALVVTQKKGIDWQWLNYILDYLNLNQYAESSAQPVLTVSKLNKLPVALPEDCNEQKKIAEILTSVDKVIELTEIEIEKLKNLKKGMMQDLLTKGIGHTKFKDSPVGNIPQSWSVISFKEVFEFKNGVNANKEQYGTGIKFINVSEIFNNDYLYPEDIPDKVNISEKEIEANKVIRGDVLFNRTSETFHEIGMTSVYLGEEPVVFGGFVIRGRQKRNIFDFDYLRYSFDEESVRSQIVRFGQGAIRANIGQKDLDKVLVRVPPIDEQKKIAQCLIAADMKISILNKKLTKNQDLKKGLMQDLLTGKVRVKV